jgi:hypothetical protein
MYHDVNLWGENINATADRTQTVSCGCKEISLKINWN